MKPLTALQTSELREHLQRLQQELQLMLQNSSNGARPVSLDEPIGRLSRMDAMQQQSMVQANRRTTQTRLSRIESALRRHADSEYGLCVECEEEIGFARLTAQPEAPFCIGCQSNKETRDA